MKTEVKKVDGITREISVEVSGDIVKNKFEEVFKKIIQEAKVSGFRQGHAPRDLIEKQYSTHAHEQVLRELIPDLYNEAIGKEKLDVIEMPQIADVKLDRSSLSFKATVEVSPEIQVKNYKGIKVDYKKISVTADEIKRNIDSLKESRKIDQADDAFAKSIGYPTIVEFEKTMERQIFIQKENQQRQKIEDEIIESLTKDLDFKLPKSLVNRQLEDMLRRTKVDLAMKGLPREKIDEQEKEILKNLEPEAQKQVKIYLVLAEIAKKENIPLNDLMPSKVMEFLLREANWTESA